MTRPPLRYGIWIASLGATVLGLAFYIESLPHLLHLFCRQSAPIKFPILMRAASVNSGHPMAQRASKTVLYIYLPVADRGLRNRSASRRLIERFALHVWGYLMEQQQAMATGLLVRVIALMEDEKPCHPAWSSDILGSVVCLPMPSECRHLRYNIPTMGCIFRTIKAHAPQEALVMYANGDLIFGPDLSEAIWSLARGQIADFIMVGRRLEIEVPGPEWYVSGALVERLEESRRLAIQHGITFSKYGMDYFVFSSRDLVPADFPEFLLGRWRWDNALMAHYLLSDISTGT